MVDSQAMQQGRVEISNRYRVFDHVVAILIRLAVADARSYAAACHPGSKATRMVVTAIVIWCKPALAVDRTAKFTAPDHQCIIQQATLFQIRNQRVGGAVRFLAEDGQ